MASCNNTYKQWLPFVEMFTNAHALGQKISNTAPSELKTPRPIVSTNHSGPTVVLCSPHPDDEILTGTLPLRLLQEKDAKVINIAITLGSNKTRKSARHHELKGACNAVGFQCRLSTYPHALDNITPISKALPDWTSKVKNLVDIFNDTQPDIIFFPHARDNHPTHQGVHLLVMDALMADKHIPHKITLIETEFWQPIQHPNLLIGISNKDLALLLAALSEHKGEITRHPYHLSQPARLMDNVRRGREIIGPRDSQPNFLFGELYRVSFWQARKGIERGNPMIMGPQCGLRGWQGTHPSGYRKATIVYRN